MSEHNHFTASKNLVWSIAINLVIVVFEIIFGIFTRSFALISDALHNVTDIGSMALSLWGEKLADKPQTDRKTFGYKRAEVLIAFINGAILLAIVGFILVEAVMRLFKPEAVSGLTVMVVATVALMGNGLATILLRKGASKNLNLKSAWLHSMQDALFSFGVLASAAVIYLTNWNWLDPLASIIISLFLLKEIFGIISEAVNMLLDSVPKDVDFSEIRAKLSIQPGIIDIGDLHIWQTGSQNRFLSAHLKIADLDDKQRMELIASIQSLLDKQYHIGHSTLQMVSAKEAGLLDFACKHCN